MDDKLKQLFGSAFFDNPAYTTILSGFKEALATKDVSMYPSSDDDVSQDVSNTVVVDFIQRPLSTHIAANSPVKIYLVSRQQGKEEVRLSYIEKAESCVFHIEQMLIDRVRRLDKKRLDSKVGSDSSMLELIGIKAGGIFELSMMLPEDAKTCRLKIQMTNEYGGNAGSILATVSLPPRWASHAMKSAYYDNFFDEDRLLSITLPLVDYQVQDALGQSVKAPPKALPQTTYKSMEEFLLGKNDKHESKGDKHEQSVAQAKDWQAAQDEKRRARLTPITNEGRAFDFDL